ncbi:MAG: 3-oxoacyl-[acyl-carrier-protein] reductase [Rhodobiaceae bacterium]|nr:3-oxoacyl-[acyl-carrier-protein] reductase [Rhodobiaceae bacterium]MCC0056511.1 3-oxoacyl-[acyl-carrier-protein] reductase [Rhodobiaceae bacterium]
MFDLTGKTALVTGATGGIGGAIAKGLRTHGARVALSGTRVEVLQELANELGGDTIVLPCNLSDMAEADGLVEKAEEAFGAPLDILINNAGITRDNIFLRMRDDEWDDVIAVDLNAVFRLTRGAIRTMMRRRTGRIIQITSVVGLIGNPGQANYTAAKAGITAMSKSIAHEVASRGVTVNCVAPGFIATPMTDKLNDKQRESILARVPAKALGTPDDIAAACVYLASDEAAYVTGHTLHVNGGMAMI